MTRWVHFSHSKKPVRVYSCPKQPENCMKPTGLWITPDDESVRNWKAWCEAEAFNVEGLRYKHDVLLHKNAKLLIVRDCEALDAVSDAYRAPGIKTSRAMLYLGLNWARMAEDYAGILITPYLHERRFSESARWYYGWDCASGCIWDSSAIVGTKLTTS